MSGHANNPCSRMNGGFTLLELLVASVIFSILVGSLYSVFYGALRLREKTHKAIVSGLPTSLMLNIIEKDLTNIVAPVGLMAGPLIGEMEEEGTQRFDTLQCHTTSGVLSDDDPWGDIQEIQYYLLEPESGRDEDGLDLVRAMNRNLLATVEEDPEEQRLLHGIESLRFEYYDGEEWRDTWDSTTSDNQTPLAISIHIEFLPTGDEDEARPPLDILCEITSESATDASSGSAAASPSFAAAGGGS